MLAPETRILDTTTLLLNQPEPMLADFERAHPAYTTPTAKAPAD
jgi:hypothetical protein